MDKKLIAATAVAVWILSRKTRPPEVDFVKVTRETIVSSLGTNGKVEPIEWLAARAERAGTITRGGAGGGGGAGGRAPEGAGGGRETGKKKRPVGGAGCASAQCRARLWPLAY